MIEKRFKVSGMTCATCSATIEMLVGNMDGVEKASVNLATEMLAVYSQEDLPSSAIIKEIKEAGYQATEQVTHMTQASQKTQTENQKNTSHPFQTAFLAIILSLPLLYLSMGSMLGLPIPAGLAPETSPQNFAFVQCLLTLPILVLGRDFYKRGGVRLFKGHPNMDSLIALGTSSAFIYSFYGMWQIFQGQTHLVHQLYFESSALIISLVLLGKSMEKQAKDQTQLAIQGLFDLAPPLVCLVKGDEEHLVSPDQVQLGDIVRIRPGEKIALDGQVIAGSTTVDEASMTGESRLVRKEIGSPILSGTLNQKGSVDYQVTTVGKDTRLNQVIALVEEAQLTKPSIASLADRISLYFVPIILTLATLSALAWYMSGQSLSFSMSIFISVLVIACPCALGLATPVAIMVATGRGAELGILIKSAQALETLQTVDVIVFDKTGTLTKGQATVTDLLCRQDISPRDALTWAASCEQKSEHLLAKAIIEKAKKEKVIPKEVTDFQVLTGYGAGAHLEGRSFWLGNDALMQKKGADTTYFSARAKEWANQGKTLVYLARDTEVLALLAIADDLKKDSQETVFELKKLGLDSILLTGDQRQTAHTIAKQVGISKVVAEVLPDEKVYFIKELQEKGARVAMVGDGLNDAAALIQADVGLAIGSGLDITLNAADMVLMHQKMMLTPSAILLSQATFTIIKENLFWAFAYNCLGIPIAMGLLHLFGGPLLSPILAGLAMSLSSVTVVSNALRLRRFKPVKQ